MGRKKDGSSKPQKSRGQALRHNLEISFYTDGGMVGTGRVL